MLQLATRFIAVCLLAAAYLPASAQITITSTNVGDQIQVGHVLSSKEDTLVTSVDIGSTGSTSWDFSGLAAHTTTALTSVTVGTTPYAAQFPGATHAFQTTQTLEGITGTVYEYFVLGTSFADMGNMGSGEVSPGITAVLHTTNTPAYVWYTFPLTYNSTWTSNYTSIMLVTVLGFPFLQDTTIHRASFLVDAYGPMTIPGGSVYQALRIRELDSITTGGITFPIVTYSFLAANGALVQVSTDPSSPTSGTIPVGGATWNGPITTDVESVTALPAEFALHQNYPNPFNPSTTVRFELASAAKVRIVVTDILGRDVAVLVDDQRAPGRYTSTWDARGMSSGVYFCRMEAGSYRSTVKMELVR
ncbi:MAG: T9SS type A sorting domain-containing protein [Bacteroidota bacterium]